MGRTGVLAGMDQTTGGDEPCTHYLWIATMDNTERIKTMDIRRVVYELKQRWGVPVDLYRVTIGEPDYQTGDKGVELTKIRIPQAIIGGFALMRKFQYSISFIRANSNFGYGGFFEVGDLFALVEGVTIEQKDFLVVRGKKYNVSRLESPLPDIHMLHLKQTSGEQFRQIHNLDVRSQVDVTQEVDYDI